MTAGDFQRFLVLPRLTITGNRATDNVNGHGPANTTLDVSTARCYPGGHVCEAHGSEPATTDGSGSYQHHFTGPNAFEGRGRVMAVWHSGFHDLVFRERVVPYLVAQAGKSGVSGVGVPGHAVHVTLRNSSGDIRATATATASSTNGAWHATLRRHGHAVDVKVGDRLKSDLASDSNLLVRDLPILVDLGTNTTKGTCYPSGAFELDYYDSNGVRLVDLPPYSLLLPDGAWSAPDPGFPLSGTTLRLACSNQAGDTLKRQVVVP